MRSFLLAVVLILCLFAGVAHAGESLQIGAMPLGSIWYVFAASFAKALQPALPAGSSIEVIARGGGIGNPVVVNEGKAQLAIANTSTSNWAWNGEQEIYKGKKHQNIRGLLGGLNEVWIVAMLTEDYIKRTGNDTLEKTLLGDKPPRVIMKPAGSTVPPVVRMALEALGTSFDKLKAKGGSLTQVDVSQIPQLMRDGRADLYFESASPGHPATQEVSLTVDVRFVDMPDKAIQAMAQHGLKVSPMPQFFKGQKGPVKSVDFGTNLIAHKDMSDDLAYRITKAICDNRDALVAEHKAMSGFVAKEAGRPENVGIPLHPGAIKYYPEKGWPH
jgi:TRAP transporter TAXI family solute receptor